MDHFMLLDLMDNGIMLLDKELEISFWNQWLEFHTNLQKKDVIGKKLTDIFPEIIKKNLRKKVEVSLKLKTSTFMDATISKYLIPIPLKTITSSMFNFMQQNVIIAPYGENSVIIVIYDYTPLLEAQELLKQQAEKFEIQATIDPLTQIYNRLKFNILLDLEVQRSRRYNRDLSIIIFDIDHFKKVNDTFGHLIGDAVLKGIASIVSSMIRTTDIFARWGGEEFILLLPETSLEGALIVAERVRVAIEKHIFPEVGTKTCSFGVTLYHKEEGEEYNQFIKRADTHLYTAKNSGRNRVISGE
ncbi:diguanylate cyclase [bacterium]|nr:diguanylate cyclase [bacterium]